MSTHKISHIALRVESLRQAVSFYARLFDLQMLRGTPPGSSGPAPTVYDMEASRDGCLLGRDDFRLLLRPGAAESAADGRLAQVGLRMLGGDLEALARTASGLGCRVVQRDAEQVLLEDVYGICWLVTAEAAAGRGGTTDP